MRADWPNLCFTARNLSRPHSAPNSLFHNILPVSRYGSRFCREAHDGSRNKPFRINILGICPKESAQLNAPKRLQFRAKFLFRNILHVSPYGSIFCQPNGLSRCSKSLGMNILGTRRKKIVGAYTQLRPLPARILAANSLLRRILRLSPISSRFCPDSTYYRHVSCSE